MILLHQWELHEQQLDQVQHEVEQRARQDRYARIILPINSCGAFTDLAIACRTGPIEHFHRSRSLTKFFGLTPTCSNSGNNDDRPGHISKQGSAIVRCPAGAAGDTRAGRRCGAASPVS